MVKKFMLFCKERMALNGWKNKTDKNKLLSVNRPSNWFVNWWDKTVSFCWLFALIYITTWSHNSSNYDSFPFKRLLYLNRSRTYIKINNVIKFDKIVQQMEQTQIYWVVFENKFPKALINCKF